MDCRSVKKLLNDFLEGTLLEGVREKINLHLGACSHCQKEKELLSKTWQILDAYTTPKLKEDFTESLMKKIHLEQAEIIKVTYKVPQFNFRRLAPALTPLFVLIIMFSFFVNRTVYKTRMHSVIPQEAEIHQKAVLTVSDQEIVQDLDILRNLELIENLNLLSEFDVIESQGASIS